MKKIILTLSLIISTVLLSAAQVYDSTIPVIQTFKIEIHNINNIVGDNSGPKLYQECGYVTIPPTYYKHDGRSLGILVVHTNLDTYMAYEIRCPLCYKRGVAGKFRMKTLLSAQCDHCIAQAENIITWESGQLTGYNHGAKEPDSLIMYDTDDYVDGSKHYVVISPNPCSIK